MMIFNKYSSSAAIITGDKKYIFLNKQKKRSLLSGDEDNIRDVWQ
ncbi:hypothetical protein [Clostridium formicaceticum]|nr:hypothetical protein [Clostridium formicaceticum]